VKKIHTLFILILVLIYFIYFSIGRKTTLIISTFFMSLTGIFQAFATCYEMFVIFAFLNAIGISGIFPLAFVLGLEMVGKRKRGVAGIVCNYFYAIGVAILGLVAWCYDHWVILQLIISIPPMILLVYYWIVPESVRWLLSKNRKTEALKIIKKAAKYNNVVLSDASIKMFTDEESSLNENETSDRKQILKAVTKMITSKKMLLRLIILLYNFAINALVYFGLSLNSVSLSGNKYFNFILVSIVEIPGYYLGFVSIEKFGRVVGFTGSMILCGITCITCGYADIVWIHVALFLIGKLGITSSFSIIYVHASEMMPTVIRSSCIGFFSTMSRIGALLSPFAPFLEKYYKPLPYIVFGTAAIFGGTIYLYLPETLNHTLPNTVEESIALGCKSEEKEYEMSRNQQNVKKNKESEIFLEESSLH
jgi:MFS transporter, OCT family, solute carrier family 22 (organic cation transporter), member 4/5